MTSIVISDGVSSYTVRPKGPLWSDIVAPHSQENNKRRKTEPEMGVITSVPSEQQEREKKKRNVTWSKRNSTRCQLNNSEQRQNLV